jgi:hypothetical protein
MFKSILNLAEDVARVVTAPIEILADGAQVVTKPSAKLAQDIVNEVKGLIGD